jgi:hypothetical protein
VTSVYTRMAYGHGDVDAVRAPSPIQRKGKDCEENAVFKREHQREQALASDTAQQQAPVKVVELQVVDKDRVQAPAPAREVQTFAPFLAQQIAQEGLPGKAPEADQRRRHEAVTEAYVQASDDAVNILGPVRSRELVV